MKAEHSKAPTRLAAFRNHRGEPVETASVTATDAKKTESKFEGALNERTLTLDREDPSSQETQRLVFRFLHANRILYYYETKADGTVTRVDFAT